MEYVKSFLETVAANAFGTNFSVQWTLGIETAQLLQKTGSNPATYAS